MAVTVTIGLVGLGTFAVFSDTQTSENNQFNAGTLKLDVENVPETVDSFVFGNIKPGDTGGWDGVSWDTWLERLEWDVTNTGSIDGVLTVSIEDIVDRYWSDAAVAGADPSNIILETAGAGDPRLSSRIRPQVRVDGVWKTESSGFHNLNPFTVDIPAGDTVNIRIAWSFQDSGNEYQGAETEFDVKFHLEQK